MRRLVLLALFALPLAACDGGDGTIPPNTEFITQRRLWRPGERDSLINFIIANRSLSLPYVGDISDDAARFYPIDSLNEIVANPAYTPVAGISPFGPTLSTFGLRVPGAGWSSSSVDVHIVNTQQSNDTFDWLVVFWVNQGEGTWKGFILAATANSTFPATTANTTAFDAANAKAGVGAGEGRFSNGTFWQANGTGAPNTFQVFSSSTVGGSSTITTGPFLGGLGWSHQMNMSINNVGLTRVLGAGAPATQTVSLSGNLTGVAYSCVFPSPCTTNVPIIAAAARRGHVPDSLMARLPWMAARSSALR